MVHDVVDGNRQQPAVPDDLPAGHQHMADVCAASRIDNVGIRVVHGRQVRRSGIENDDVRLFADFKRSDSIRQTDGPGPVDSGHVEHAGCIQGRGIAGGHLVQLGGRVHLSEQVQVVVAGAAVGAQ